MGGEDFHADGQRGTTKRIISFRDFVNLLKKPIGYINTNNHCLLPEVCSTASIQAMDKLHILFILRQAVSVVTTIP